MKETIQITDHTGKKLHTVQWMPEHDNPKGVVQIIHGLAEHSARYSHFASFLIRHGYAVVAHDHRGHGYTDRDHLGFVADEGGFDLLVKNVRDVRQYINSQYSGIPLVMFGHSMGSFLLQRFMQVFDEKPAGVIYSGSDGRPPATLGAGILIASILKNVQGEHAKSKLLYQMSFGSYNNHFKPNRTVADWLSRDNDMVDLYMDDPLCGFVCTTSFYHQLFTGLRKLHSHKPFAGKHTGVPVYVMSGDHDPVSKMGKGIRNLEKLLRKSGVKNLRVRLYKGGRHEMLNETNRDEVMQDILQWIESEIRKPV